jgi:hypothetical protein
MSKTLKSKELKELEKKLSRQTKENSEKKIKQVLSDKVIDYDTVKTILDVFKKSKFQWLDEHFDIFDLRPEEFRGKELPKNNRECLMLGMRLGNMRSKVIFNLRGMQFTEKHRQAMDDLIWSLIWYQWKEARQINNFSVKEKNE